MRIDLHPVFILHTRAYRETSLILEVFSRDHGRIGVVARGARGRKSRYQGYLQAFLPLQMGWSGRGELVTLNGVEAEHGLMHLPASKLASGFYLNEIMMRLVHRHEPMPELFVDYAMVLQALRGNHPEEHALRCFELRLLAHLGYGLQLTDDVDGEAIQPDSLYQYLPEQGPCLQTTQAGSAGLQISGQTLLALAKDALSTEQELREAKRLMRYILSTHLGDRPLHSRELFTAWRGK
jgi:DNA repair protein RecO (recombination protein O)